MTTHTPGPWFADALGNIWRRPPSELYANGGLIAKDKPIAFVTAGWTGGGFTGYPVEDNARLIAAAPDLLEALKWMVLRAEEGGYPDGKCLEVAHAAIARATGEQL